MATNLEIKKLDRTYKEILERIYVESEFIDPIDEIIEKIEDETKEPISQPFKVSDNHEIVSFFTIESSNPNIENQKESEGAYWLESFFITKKFLGKGYSKRVVIKLLQTINCFYPNLSSLNLTVNFQNEIAQNLYKKCGFMDTGKIYLQGPVGPQYIYKKQIKKC